MQPLKPATILIVDDRKENLMVLEVALSEVENCTVVSRNSGIEALEFLKTNDAAVILLDIQMPIMDGFQTAREIRKFPNHGSTPILFVTAIDNSKEHVRKAYEVGGADFIFKPIDTDILKAKVAVFLDLFDSRRRLAETLNRQADLERRAHEHELATVINTMTVGFSAYDKNYVLTHANDQVEIFLGQPKAQLIGKKAEELFPGEDRLKFQAHYDRVMETGISDRFEETYEGRWLQCHAYRSSDGGVAVFFSDITEQKTAQEAIAKSEKTLDQIFSESPSFMAFLSYPDFRFERANEEYFKLIGQRDILGKTVAEALPETVGQGFIGLLNNVALTGQPFVGKDVLVTFDKGNNGQPKHVYLDFVYQPLADPSGRVYGIAAQGYDVTEKVLARKRLEESERSLRAYAEEAQKLNRLKDEFLATLSHELRTPINVIQGHSEILLNEFDQLNIKEIRDSIEAIYRNTKLQTQIVSDLLDVSSIITGKVIYSPQDITPADVAVNVANTIRPTAKAKGIEVTCTVKDAPARLSADPIRLHQVLWNLVNNAVKFSNRGDKIEIKVSTKPDACVFEINDTGIGIEAEFLPYVFDRFQQEDSSMSRKFGGLGLGLSIVKSLVEIHGGTVEAKSQGRGKGATFIVSLPLSPSYSYQAPASHLHDVNTAAPPPPTLKLKGISILLVEDSPDNRVLVSRMLKKAGAIIFEAEGPHQAREILRKTDVHLILSDIGMPEENGLEFVRWLRKQKKYEATPAIALTAYARPEEREEALSAGFHGHISKPVSSAILLPEIERILRSEHLERI